FQQHGIGSIVIDSAGIRNVKRLTNTSALVLASDVQAAIDQVRAQSDFDVKHFAVMGFSRGGTAALYTPSKLRKDTLQPDFIFALYPGNNGSCSSHAKEITDTHVFYGELDKWGTYQGNRTACKRMANQSENTTFHLLNNAHHGYDIEWTGTWPSNGKKFKSAPNEAAFQTTKEAILNAMKTRWSIQ
ncbi:MAG: dienelactone hydrolase family protein, partial [Pseudomonadales bacterium]